MSDWMFPDFFQIIYLLNVHQNERTVLSHRASSTSQCTTDEGDITHRDHTAVLEGTLIGTYLIFDVSAEIVGQQELLTNIDIIVSNTDEGENLC